MLSSLPNKVSYIRNDKNEGIARALNQILGFAEERCYQYFLTLDQDSVCNPGLIDMYKSIVKPDAAQVTCRIIDKDNEEIDAVPFEGNRFIIVDYCITSGCINNTDAIKQVGGYDERLFIDGVDLDLSLRLKKAGY